jgi:hypothetical protein
MGLGGVLSGMRDFEYVGLYGGGDNCSRGDAPANRASRI